MKSDTEQLTLNLGMIEQINPSPIAHQCAWSIYWGPQNELMKRCLKCGGTDIPYPPKDLEQIKYQIMHLEGYIKSAELSAQQQKDPAKEQHFLKTKQKHWQRLSILEKMLADYNLPSQTTLSLPPSTDPDIPPSTNIKEGDRGYYQGQPCTIDKILKNGKIKIVTSDLERHTIKPDEFRLQYELQIQELTNIVQTLTPSTDPEITPSTDPEITPSTKKRPKGDGTGYIIKRTLKRKNRTYIQYFYSYETAEGKKRCRYIPQNYEEQVFQLNREKAPVKRILELLPPPKQKG